MVDSLQKILGGGIPAGQMAVLGGGGHGSLLVAPKRHDHEDPVEAQKDVDESEYAAPAKRPSGLLSKLLTRVNPLPPLTLNIPERM